MTLRGKDQQGAQKGVEGLSDTDDERDMVLIAWRSAKTTNRCARRCVVITQGYCPDLLIPERLLSEPPIHRGHEPPRGVGPIASSSARRLRLADTGGKIKRRSAVGRFADYPCVCREARLA